MKNTYKKPINKFKLIFRILICLFTAGLAIQGQAQNQPVDITLTDTTDYTDFGISKMAEINYPPSNLFDGKLNTCWVSNLSIQSTNSIYIRIPNTLNDSIYLSIFSGYGKSMSLFSKNSKPQELILRFYAAFTPDGYVTEYNYLCKAFKLPNSQTIALKDTFDIQNFRLQYTRNDIREYGGNNRKQLNYINLADTIELIRIDVSKNYTGSMYEQDICISEIYFDNCYTVITDKQKTGKISAVYLNDNENELWIIKNNMPVRVYSDKYSTFQIIQQSDNNEWVILIAMSNETEGRVEVTYLVFDLIQEELINGKLKKILHSYNSGEALYLETIEGKLFLVTNSLSTKESKVELRHWFH